MLAVSCIVINNEIYLKPVFRQELDDLRSTCSGVLHLWEEGVPKNVSQVVYYQPDVAGGNTKP